jgi:hypothetical protein
VQTCNLKGEKKIKDNNKKELLPYQIEKKKNNLKGIIRKLANAIVLMNRENEIE